MAKAFKCDRCGKLFERPTLPDVRVAVYNNNCSEGYLDLCDTCQEQLERWLKKEGFTNEPS